MTNGKTLLLNIRKENNVEDIKIKIEQREGIPRHLQKLRLGLKHLNKDCNLNTIWENSRIMSLELKLGLSGGMLGRVKIGQLH